MWFSDYILYSLLVKGLYITHAVVKNLCVVACSMTENDKHQQQVQHTMFMFAHYNTKIYLLAFSLA